MAYMCAIRFIQSTWVRNCGAMQLRTSWCRVEIISEMESSLAHTEHRDGLENCIRTLIDILEVKLIIILLSFKNIISSCLAKRA